MKGWKQQDGLRVQEDTRELFKPTQLSPGFFIAKETAMTHVEYDFIDTSATPSCDGVLLLQPFISRQSEGKYSCCFRPEKNRAEDNQREKGQGRSPHGA